MSPKALKIALIVSVVLNLVAIFAIAAGTTVWVGRAKVENRIEAVQSAQQNRSPFSALLDRLNPSVRERVRTTLKASALSAKPDFEEARTKRRAAVELAGSPNYDPARVRALLDESRAAEIRGRTRLEADAVQLLGTLEPADRRVLADILSRRGRSAPKTHAEAPTETKRP